MENATLYILKKGKQEKRKKRKEKDDTQSFILVQNYTWFLRGFGLGGLQVGWLRLLLLRRRRLFTRWLALRLSFVGTGRQTDAGIGRHIVLDRLLTASHSN